ncbi:4'-phosphopantetheinyl transferase superfamily [Schizophyllum commune]
MKRYVVIIISIAQSIDRHKLYEAGLELVDAESQARIKRFYHRADACRCLIGRLLPRVLLKQHGIPAAQMTFGKTDAGKPYVTTPLDPSIAFNVSHDSSFVAMVFAPGGANPPAYSVGVDIMEVRMPRGETYASLTETFGEQLTTLERRQLRALQPEEGLRHFFWIWTTKEAYTKALGIGLGFDFNRVEVDVAARTIRIDGVIPQGWRLTRFEATSPEGAPYVGVTAELTTDNTPATITDAGSDTPIVRHDAAEFIRNAVSVLGGDK